MLLPLAAMADTFDDVVNNIKLSNIEVLSKYFNNNIELTLLDNEGVYSKSQAELMLKNFLAKYPAKTVDIQHRGSSAQGAKYAISNYETASGVKLRLYIFMKDSGKGLMIHELRFEKE